MRRLLMLRRHVPSWQCFGKRSPESSDGFDLNMRGARLITQASSSIFSPCQVELPAKSETLEVPYFRRIPANYYFSSFLSNLANGRRLAAGSLSLQRYSTINDRDDSALEEEVEKKAGWLLKAIFIVTALGVASQFFPYMGDNLLQQSISLLYVKDPLFKRMGASRLRRFAIDDDRRMRVVEFGGAQELLKMLEGAKDAKTRKEALKTLLALSHSDAVADVLHQSGAAAIVSSTPDSSEFDEIYNCKASLLKKFKGLEDNQSLSEVQLS